MVTRHNRPESDAAHTADELRELLQARTLEVAELRRKLADLQARGTGFLTAASHAVTNPLTIIQSYLEIVLSDLRGGLSDQQAGFVETAHAAALRMHRLIDDLVELAALEMGAAELEMSAVEVGDVVADILASFSPAAETGGIALSVSINPDLPRVKADPARLRNAVDAVVSNAIRLTPRGGRVRVTVSQNDDRVVIGVEDTGPGIPGDRLEQVFEPFVRLSRRNGEPPAGAGLGLSLARRQIEAFGGHIEVSSAIDDGSSFSLVIPALTEDR
jgi:two-component system sensor histidine kinase ResE